MQLTHGEICKTKTWPTKCPSCSAKVFFFSCSCGSKVFFDELGIPWPIHDCEESWGRSLKRYKDDNGDLVVEIAPGISAIRELGERRSFKINEGGTAHYPSDEKKRHSWEINAIEPERVLSESHIGLLREIRVAADPFKAFKFDRTPVAKAFLGPLGSERMGKVTVHVPYPTEAYVESFNCWIPTRFLKSNTVQRDVTVEVTLDRIEVLDRGFTWYCRRFLIL